MIKLPPGTDKVKLVQKVYELSRPKGMGALHFAPGPLSVADARGCISETSIGMDYVHGRDCKFGARIAKDGSVELPDSWYDHSDAQYEQLLKEFGATLPAKAKHGTACECVDCKGKAPGG